MIEQQHHLEDHRMNITSVGIDLGKTTFHLVALDDQGRITMKKKWTIHYRQ